LPLHSCHTNLGATTPDAVAALAERAPPVRPDPTDTHANPGVSTATTHATRTLTLRTPASDQ
jgi:hypothetical protein